MPIYEYQCEDCNTKFEILRPMKDADSPITCKKCTGMHTRRKLSTCYSHSDGRSLTPASGGCNGCSGGTCSGCGSH